MRDVGFSVIPLQDRVTGSIRRPLLILTLAVGCVLLVACANVAGASQKTWPLSLGKTKKRFASRHARL